MKLEMHWTQHPYKTAGLYRSGSPVEVIDKKYAYPEGFNFAMDGGPVGGARPGIRSPWYDAKCADIGSSRGVAMDLDINPSGAVSQFFDPLVISELVRTHAIDPCWEGELRNTPGEPVALAQQDRGKIKLWLQPDVQGRPPVGRYAAAADISMGTGASPSCLAVANADTGEKVLEYQNALLSPDQFADFVYQLLRLFPDENKTVPQLVWEIPGPGNVFFRKIAELGYRHFWYRDRDNNPFAVAANVNPGFDPRPSNVLVLLEEYRTALRTREFLNRSASALKDTLNFKYTRTGHVKYGGGHSGGTIRAEADDESGAGANHGDQTMADALVCMLVKGMGVLKQAQGRRDDPRRQPGLET